MHIKELSHDLGKFACRGHVLYVILSILPQQVITMIEDKKTYILAVPAFGVSSPRGTHKQVLRRKQQLYEIIGHFEDPTEIAQTPIYKKGYRKREKQMVILEKSGSSVAPINLRSVSHKVSLQARYNTSNGIHIESLRSKLAKQGIKNAMDLIEHKGSSLVHLAQNVGCKEEISMVLRKGSSTLTTKDLFDLANTLGRDYEQEFINRLAQQGVKNSVDIYNVKLDRLMDRISHVHRRHFVGYEFQTQAKTNEAKKQDLIHRLKFNIIEDTKTVLHEKHNINDTVSFLRHRNESVYKSLHNKVLNKILNDKPQIEKYNQVSLIRQLLFCRKIGRNIARDLYNHLAGSQDSAKELIELFGSQAAMITELFIRELMILDKQNNRLLYTKAKQYCKQNSIRFRQDDLKRRQKNYLLIMLLLGGSYKKHEPNIVHSEDGQTRSYVRIINRANGEVAQ